MSPGPLSLFLIAGAVLGILVLCYFSSAFLVLLILLLFLFFLPALLLGIAIRLAHEGSYLSAKHLLRICLFLAIEGPLKLAKDMGGTCYVELSKLAFLEEDYESARAWADKALAIDCASVIQSYRFEALSVSAIVQLKLGNKQKARELLDSAWEDFGTFKDLISSEARRKALIQADNFIALALISLSDGDFQKSFELFARSRRLLARSPSQVDALISQYSQQMDEAHLSSSNKLPEDLKQDQDTVETAFAILFNLKKLRSKEAEDAYVAVSTRLLYPNRKYKSWTRENSKGSQQDETSIFKAVPPAKDPGWTVALSVLFELLYFFSIFRLAPLGLRALAFPLGAILLSLAVLLPLPMINRMSAELRARTIGSALGLALVLTYNEFNRIDGHLLSNAGELITVIIMFSASSLLIQRLEWIVYSSVLKK